MTRRCVLLCLLLSGCFALALSPKDSPAGVPPRHTFEAALMLHAFDYNEDFPPPGKSSEYGWLVSSVLRYSYKGGSSLPLFGRAHVELSPSGTEYGSNEADAQGRLTDFTETTQNWFSRFEAEGGYIFHNVWKSAVSLTPYTGYGYRFWRRQLSGHADLLGYREDYSWTYLPVGLRSELSLGRSWSVALDIAMRIMLSGNIFIRLQQYGSPTLTLGNRTGWYAALPVTYETSAMLGVGLTLVYEYSAIDKSTESPHVRLGQQEVWIYEPPSRTHQFGFMFTGWYSF